VFVSNCESLTLRGIKPNSCVAIMILSFTSSKGGVGKSTSCAALACALAGTGDQVLVLDLDPNKTLDRWYRKAPYPRLAVTHCAPEAFATTFREAQASGRYDHILIDLAGFLHTDILRAFARADLVIIPAVPSEPDLREALVMARHLAGVSESVDRAIPYRLLLTRVRPLQSRVATYIYGQIEAQKLLRFDRMMIEREAYKEIFVTGRPPTDTEPDKAGAEVMAILDEIREIVKSRPTTKIAGAA
jgi:chromosome partitioning protein